MAIYTRSVAVEILDLFDDFLAERGIRIPSDEDEQRGENNDAALYGMVYASLLDAVEDIVTDAVTDAKTEEIIMGVLG